MNRMYLLIVIVCGGLFAGCGDPASRCAGAIQSTQEKIDASRLKERDVNRINQLAVVAAHLMSADVDRKAGDYKGCSAEVDQAREGLDKFEKGR